MIRLTALLTLSVLASSASPASLPEAFSQGSTFGRAGNAAARIRIDQGTAAGSVPGYTTSAPASNYFGTTPSLGAPASATLAACAGAAAASTPECLAVNFSQTNAARRPQFVIAPENPMLVLSKSITADPHAIAGNLTGTYSACSQQTLKNPDIFEKRVCNEYRTLERLTCDKTLIVTVTDHGLNCTEGSYLTPNPRIYWIRPYVFVGAICADDIRFQWIYGYSECNGTTDSIYVQTVVPTDAPIRMSVNLGCGGIHILDGSCPNGSCAYSIVELNAEIGCLRYCRDDGGCCEPVYGESARASFTFERPRRTYTVTDAWDNQCAPLEARLP